MDATPTPRATVRLLVEIDRSPDGRLEGRIRTEADNPWRAYSGVLELLKVLEELLDDDHLHSNQPPRPQLPKTGLS
jgi:hypothetical protein